MTPRAGQASPPLARVLRRLGVLCDPSHSERVMELMLRLSAGTLRVLMVGEAKRGKSTLANALLGRNLLPAGVIPVTALATEIREGSPERIEVAFRDGRSETAPVEDLHAYVDERENPRNTRSVSGVTVFLTTGLPDAGMVLVDTPGVGSVHSHNSETAMAAYQSMDAAVFVLTADAPLSAQEVLLLRRATDLSVRCFLVLNKSDLVEPDELGQLRRFVVDSVQEATGQPVTLLECSARNGLRARLAQDFTAWETSGVAALESALVRELTVHRDAHLRRSVAAGAYRIAAGALDEAMATIAGIAALTDDQMGQVEAFAARVEETDRRREEAARLLVSDTSARLDQLAEDVREQVRSLTRETLGALEHVIASSGDLPVAEVDALGRETLANAIQAGVDGWRTAQHRALTDALTSHATRQQELLRREAEGLARAAHDLLGVELVGPAPDLPTPSLPNLRLDFSPQVGWNTSAVDLLRKAGPGSLARRRVAAHLREECRRLVDQSLGRARSDLHDRMTSATRDMVRVVSEAFEDLSAGLRRAHRAATEVLKGSGADRDIAKAEAMSRVEELRQLLVELRYVAAGGSAAANSNEVKA